MRAAAKLLAPRTIRVLAMPQLSPTMSVATIEAIHLDVGSLVKSYDLALEVSTMQLTSTQGADVLSRLQVEVLEDDLTVLKLLARVGDTLAVGEPIAILADGSAELDLERIGDQPRALWQAYVIDKNDSGTCGCN